MTNELEEKVKKAVKDMTELASDEGEHKVTGYLSGHTKDTVSHKDLVEHHGKSIGDEKAREIAAKIVEIYHGKVRGESDTYKNDKQYWLGFARTRLGDNYPTFLEHIKKGDISSAANLLQSAITNEDLTIRAHGIAESVYAMSPEDRLKWGEEIAKVIGPDADAQKLAERPEDAYSALRAVREAKRAVKKPKPEPVYK